MTRVFLNKHRAFHSVLLHCARTRLCCVSTVIPEIVMNKFEAIRQSLARLSEAERQEIIAWLERDNERLYGADRVEEALIVPFQPRNDFLTLRFTQTRER